MLESGRRYVVVPECRIVNGRPVYSTACRDDGAFRVVVPQNAVKDGRPVEATAGCLDGQGLDDWRVVAVPQNKIADGRPVYAFACCPGGSSSSSSSSGSPPSGSPSGSGGSGGSGSGSISYVTSACIQAACGSANAKMPAALILNVSGADLGLNGNYAINYDSNSGCWVSSTFANEAFCTAQLEVCCSSGVFCGGILLNGNTAGALGATACNLGNSSTPGFSCNPVFMMGNLDGGSSPGWSCTLFGGSECCTGSSLFHAGTWTVTQ